MSCACLGRLLQRPCTAKLFRASTTTEHPTNQPTNPSLYQTQNSSRQTMILQKLPSRALLPPPLLRLLRTCPIRAIALTTPNFGKPMPPRPSVKEEEIEESFLKGSPFAAVLYHIIRNSHGQSTHADEGATPANVSAVVSIPAPHSILVCAAYTLHYTKDTNKKPKQNKTSSAVQLKHLPTGIVVKSQATRSRSQNRKIARKILAEKLEFMEHGVESRLGALVERDRKRKASKTKKAKRKRSRAMIDCGRVVIDEPVRYAKLEADRLASDSEGEVESGEGMEHAENGEGESTDEQVDRSVRPKRGTPDPGSASTITALNDSKPPYSARGIND
ncbi:unnamed protein product [Tuber aestivum]|uniref:Prokaryotic-type class I peptide chain release factors domain-containing protein n=1 Tax=Tuber aestivum TaxID=59557 RepID=A0A292Q220_9PEZI|nr:unnamed protein product [Tuber aestivum]